MSVGRSERSSPLGRISNAASGKPEAKSEPFPPPSVFSQNAAFVDINPYI